MLRVEKGQSGEMIPTPEPLLLENSVTVGVSLLMCGFPLLVLGIIALASWGNVGKNGARNE